MAAKKVKLYQFEESPFCDKVRRILHFKSIDYEIEEVPLLASLKSIHPQGKLPVIEFEDGTKVVDSTDIALELEKRYPEPSIYPSSTKDKALCNIIEDWADEYLYFFEIRLRFLTGNNAERTVPLLTKNSGVVVKYSMSFIVNSIMAGILNKQGLGRKSDAEFQVSLDNQVKAAADYLEDSQFFFGDLLTIADISVFAQLRCFYQTPEGNAAMSKHPKLIEWYERVKGKTDKN